MKCKKKKQKRIKKIKTLENTKKQFEHHLIKPYLIRIIKMKNKKNM